MRDDGHAPTPGFLPPHPEGDTGSHPHTFLENSGPTAVEELDVCEHEVKPVPGSEDWGRCVKCGDDGFPLTGMAAYGDVRCETCKDTGVVPVFVPEGTIIHSKKFGPHDASKAFLDGRCPDCEEGRL